MPCSRGAESHKKPCSKDPPQVTSYNTFNQKAFNKVFSFSLYCLLYPQSLLHSSISIPSGKSQLIPSFITSLHLYLSSPICPFPLSFWGTLGNSQSIKQLPINICVFTDQSQPPDRFPCFSICYFHLLQLFFPLLSPLLSSVEFPPSIWALF